MREKNKQIRPRSSYPCRCNLHHLYSHMPQLVFVHIVPSQKIDCLIMSFVCVVGSAKRGRWILLVHKERGYTIFDDLSVLYHDAFIFLDFTHFHFGC